MTMCCKFAYVCQILDDGPPSKPYQWQNRSVTEWTCQQVSCWLMGLNLEQYVSLFTAKNVDGEQLLKLDSTALKVRNRFVVRI